MALLNVSIHHLRRLAFTNLIYAVRYALKPRHRYEEAHAGVFLDTKKRKKKALSAIRRYGGKNFRKFS